jgi:hypothetical protein
MQRGDRSKIVSQIFERKDSELLKLVIALIDLLVEENRGKFDTASPEDIPKIQGRIVQLKELGDIFKKPIIKS